MYVFISSLEVIHKRRHFSMCIIENLGMAFTLWCMKMNSQITSIHYVTLVDWPTILCNIVINYKRIVNIIFLYSFTPATHFRQFNLYKNIFQPFGNKLSTHKWKTQDMKNTGYKKYSPLPVEVSACADECRHPVGSERLNKL